MMFSQHLQIIDKRTCWHGHAGGKLNADPKNVVSTLPSFCFFFYAAFFAAITGPIFAYAY